MTSANRKAWLGAIAIIALCFLAYGSLLGAGFIWDDIDAIFVSSKANTLGALWKIWFDPAATPQYYPLTYSELWAELTLWGLDPRWFHATNILFHAFGAIALWSVLVVLELPGAWAAAALFAVHPVQVETVAWIHERKNILSFLFAMLSLAAYLRVEKLSRARQPSERGKVVRTYAFSLALFLAALLCKTVACSLPVVAGLLVFWKRGELRREILLSLIPFFAFGLILAGATVFFEHHHVGATGTGFALSPLDRILISGHALWFYLEKLVWPHPLAFIYARWNIQPARLLDWIFPLAWLALLLGLTLRWRERRGALTVFLIFSAVLFPALGFINVYPMIYSFVADHFQYMACAAPIAGAAALAAKLAHGERRKFGVAVLAVLILALSATSRARALDYDTQEGLWQDTLAKDPGSWISMNNLGTIYARQGQLKDSERYFRSALQTNAEDVSAMINLANAELKQGRPAEADAQIREALQRRPDLGMAHLILGKALNAEGKAMEAAPELEHAVQLDPSLRNQVQ